LGFSKTIRLTCRTSYAQLEATYCDLEVLDNATPEVVELRSQRIERALWINERLIALGDGKDGADDMDDQSDEEYEDADSEDEDESERLATRLGKQRIA